MSQRINIHKIGDKKFQFENPSKKGAIKLGSWYSKTITLTDATTSKKEDLDYISLINFVNKEIDAINKENKNSNIKIKKLKTGFLGFGGAKKTEVIDSLNQVLLLRLKNTVEIKIDPVLTPNEEQGPQMIEFGNASEEIKDQARNLWQKRTSDKEDRVLCYCQGKDLIGCVSLKENPENHKAFDLNIELTPKHQGQGLGRKIFESSCAFAIDQDRIITLTDMAGKGIGEKLYGGEKTREKFDVSITLNGANGHEYTISKKTGVTGKANLLTYNKIEELKDKLYILYDASDSLLSFNHLVKYMEQNKEDLKFIDENLVKHFEWNLNHLSGHEKEEYSLLLNQLTAMT